MTRFRMLLTFVATAFVLAGFVTHVHGQARQAQPERTIWNFDADTKLPNGWKVDATNPGGPLAVWAVERTKDAPSGSNALALNKVNDTVRGVYNLCWTDEVNFQDGGVEVKVCGNAGKIDQGGGPIWRVQDAKNYYIARYNPLENNFRVYYVKDGKRIQIADAPDIDIKTGEWFTIRIIYRDDLIRAMLNGEQLIEVTDATIGNAGGVGVWTKADAASSFDDFQIRVFSR